MTLLRNVDLTQLKNINEMQTPLGQKKAGYIIEDELEIAKKLRVHLKLK